MGVEKSKPQAQSTGVIPLKVKVDGTVGMFLSSTIAIELTIGLTKHSNQRRWGT